MFIILIMQKKLTFDYVKVIKDQKKYIPREFGWNMYIFEYTKNNRNNYYAFNYGTCFFYLLRYCQELKCYYIDQTLNYYLPVDFFVYEWIKDNKTDEIIHIRKRNRNSLTYDIAI